MANLKATLTSLLPFELPKIANGRFNLTIAVSSLHTLLDSGVERYGYFYYGFYAVVFSTLFDDQYQVDLINRKELEDWVRGNMVENNRVLLSKKVDSLPILKEVAMSLMKKINSL